MVAAPPTPLDFTLRFVDGKGFLGLRERAAVDLASVERLELEIPHLRFPFDVSGGAQRFQSRRCQLTEAELKLAGSRVAAFLSSRPQLARYGIRGLRARVEEGRIELEGRARVGEREAPFTARVRLGKAAQRLRAYLSDLRLYGFLGAPAPLIGLGLLLGTGGGTIEGVDAVETNPLELVLWHALPPQGWRLPRFRATPLSDVRVERGEIVLRYGAEPIPSARETVALEELHRATLPGDRRLEAGDLPGALKIYGQLAAIDDRPELAERELALRAALPARFNEAVAHAARLLERFPERPFALLTLAAIETERGDLSRAAGRYQRACELATRAGETADAAFAALAAGELHARAGHPEATRWLERALSDRPDDPVALARIGERYGAEGRFRDLLQLEKRLLAGAGNAAEEAAARTRIGQLWLDHLGDPDRALAELEQVVRLVERASATERLYARALDAAGHPARALEAIERALALAPDDRTGAELALEAAAIAERTGALDAALAHVRTAASRAPELADAPLREATLLERLGRAAEARAALERALRLAEGEDVRAALLCRLGRLAEGALQDRSAARDYVERSLAIQPSLEALRIAAQLAEADGRTDDLQRLLRALADGGDRDAQLQHLRLLFGLGQFAATAEAAESLASYRPAEALPILVAAREALGGVAEIRRALERLVAVRPDAGARARLARILADQGELQEARDLLTEGLAGAPSADDARELHEALCDVLLRIGDDALLEVALGRLAVVRPDARSRAHALLAQGAARARLGLTAEAAESYRAALALEPDEAQALAGLGEAAWSLRLWDEARAALEPLYTRGLPPRVERALRLGEIAERQGQSSAAIAFYQAGLEAGAVGADAVHAWNALQRLHRGRSDLDAEARTLIAAAADPRTGESDAARAGRLVTAAELTRKQAGRLDEAQALYERALALDPLQLAALDALESLAEATGDATQLAQVLGRKVAATAKRPAQQKAILGRLAELQAERLGRPDAAREAYQRALAIDADFRPALRFLASDLRASGDTLGERALLERLTALAPDPADPDEHARERVRLGALHLAEGRPQEAEALARRTLDASPRHPGALALLDEIYTLTDRTDDLAGVLGERARAAGATEPGVDLLQRRAALLDGAGRRRDAIAAYQELITLRPSLAAAWNRLAALLRIEELWEPLAGVLTRLAEQQATEERMGEAEALHIEVAHLFHDRLHDRDRARAALTRALEIAPGSRVALSGLLALTRARGDALEEDALLGRLAEIEQRPQPRALAIAERARVRASRGDLDGALALLRDLDHESTPDSVLRLHVELEESRAGGPSPESGAALELVRAHARHAGDVTGERWALKRLVRFVSERGPSPAAEEMLRRAVELDPDDREATRSLAILERKRGDDRAYLDSLERMLRTARKSFEGGAREAELGVEMARVQVRLGDASGALNRLREAIEAAPESGAAHRLRGTLLRQAGLQSDAVLALERAGELAALDGPGQVELAELYLERGDATRAATAFLLAGDAAPPRPLAEALERAGREVEAAQVWRTLGGDDARMALARLSRRRAERALHLGRASEARAAAVEALIADPHDSQALEWATSGLSPAGVLALLDDLAQRIRPADAAALLGRVAARLAPDEARLALERAVELHADAKTLVALGDLEQGAQAARHYQRALELDPTDPNAARGLIRQTSPNEAARLLSVAHEATQEGPARARLSALLGALWRDGLHQPSEAREHFRRAVLESQPSEALRADALRSLAALTHAARDVRNAIDALELLRTEGAARDVDLRYLAELYAERGDYDAALALLDGVAGSTELLIRFYEASGKHAELVRLIESEAPLRMPEEARSLYLRAAHVSAGSLADPARAAQLLELAVPLGPSDPDLWLRLGRLYHDSLSDRSRAALCFARAFAADRSRVEVLLPLASFHHDAGDGSPARDYYAQALAAGAIPTAELARVHLRMAEYARADADQIAEETSLRAAVAAGAEPAPWARLAELYRERGDGRRLAEALQRMASEQRGPERAALLREAATLLPPDEAALLYEQIAEDDPDDEAARERVLARARQSGDDHALALRLDREIELSPPVRRAAFSLERGRLAHKAGELARAEAAFRGSLADAPGAEAASALHQLLASSGRESESASALEAALFDARLAAADRPALLALATRAHLATGADGAQSLGFVDRARAAGLDPEIPRTTLHALFRAGRRYAALVATLDQEALAETDPDARVTLALEAAELVGRELAEPAQAARRAAELLSMHPARRDLAERARRYFTAAGDPRKALEVLEHETKLAGPDELPQLKIVRGELLLEAGLDNEAEAEFLHALITTKRVGRAHAALAAVYQKRGDIAGALEHLIAAADSSDLEPVRAAQCAVDAADVLLREGDAVTADRLYQLAAVLDPADRRAVEGLAKLAAARGDYERVAELLGRAAQLTPDRRERARLALERAHLFARELDREADAYRSYKEAVAADPSLREATRGLRAMAEARGEWALAAEQLNREIAVTSDELARAPLHIELARLLEEKLLDADEALRNYEQAATLLSERAAGRGAPFADLVRLYLGGGRLHEAAAAADRLADSLHHPADKAAALERAAELYERVSDSEAARERLSRAAALGGEIGRRADDSLLRLVGQAGDPQEFRTRIEERLAIEPEGELRLELLRRLLTLAAQAGDHAQVDIRAQEILERAPEDPIAFVERKRLLEQRGDEAGVAELLRARAAAVEDPVERAARRFEAGRIAERMGNTPAAFADYEAALATDAAYVPALDALADLAYRARQLARARGLYNALGARPSALAPDEVLRRRAELAEEAGDLHEALRFYRAAALQNSSNLAAHEALARLQLERGDQPAALHSLKALLELVPLDAVERITDLRRQIGKLALRIGDQEQARHYFELVLAQDPTRSDALEALAQLYVDAEMWEDAAQAFSRLSYLVTRPAERAELLFRRGEILRTRLGDLDRANDAYLKAADLHPTHAPTLRRLIHYYYQEGEHAQVVEVVRELESLPAPLEDAAIEAGLGIALGGDEARGTIVVAVAQPSPDRVASAVANARVRDLAHLDAALRTAARALAGGKHGRQALVEGLLQRIRERPAHLGAHLALGRLFDSNGQPQRARLHYAVPAFVDWTGTAERRLRELPPPEPFRLDEERLIHPSARGPLREALVAIGPLVIGLPPASIDAEPAPAWGERLAAVVASVYPTEFVTSVVTELLDPAWAEPTRPPRLLLHRRTLGDEWVARFAAVRAMHCLRAGVSLIEGRSPEDVAALVHAAAALFLPDLKASLARGGGTFTLSWRAELRALALRPEELPERARTHAEVALATCVLDAKALRSGADYSAAERLTADRVALAATGDLRAGLLALCPSDATTPEARLAALSSAKGLVELLAFAATLA